MTGWIADLAGRTEGEEVAYPGGGALSVRAGAALLQHANISSSATPTAPASVAAGLRILIRIRTFLVRSGKSYRYFGNVKLFKQGTVCILKIEV